MLKKIVSRLPHRLQQGLKRIYFSNKIKRGLFRSDEPEYYILDQWVNHGDCVIDIGANVGHYTLQLSRLVGPDGRVFVFEPVSSSFELLVANISSAKCSNVTCFNVAASNSTTFLGMHIPCFNNGMSNYYMANLTTNRSVTSPNVFCMPVDNVNINLKVKLVKLDVEGHELLALHGMELLIKRDFPVFIIEGRSDDVASYLTGFGYSFEELDSSPNRIFSR